MRCGGMEYGYNCNKKRRTSKMGDHAAEKKTDEIMKNQGRQLIIMKKKICAVLAITMMLSLTGCQSTTKNLGGSTTIELEPNQKLEEITWKNDSLWYLTRPMTDADIAETHTFKESSNFGLIEGTVTIIEKRQEE